MAPSFPFPVRTSTPFADEASLPDPSELEPGRDVAVTQNGKAYLVGWNAAGTAHRWVQISEFEPVRLVTSQATPARSTVPQPAPPGETLTPSILWKMSRRVILWGAARIIETPG